MDLKKGQFKISIVKLILPIKIFLHVNDYIVFQKQSIHNYFSFIIVLYTDIVVHVSGLLTRFQLVGRELKQEGSCFVSFFMLLCNEVAAVILMRSCHYSDKPYVQCINRMIKSEV